MSTNRNWEELIERHLRGELTELEMEQLAEHLDSAPDARQIIVEEALWDTRMTEVLRGFPADETGEQLSIHATSDLEQQKSTNIVLRVMLAGAVAVIVVLSVGLYQQRARAERRIAEIKATAPEARPEPSIAKVVGLSGSLIWTGNRGEIDRELKVGTELTGGTIEGVAPDSWFELQFNDGSTVMITGTSMLTFADAGQKVLRLKEGNLSASVEPQPAESPMLIHTHTALLEVLGTRFKVEADLSSTALNVSEGRVRLKRLSDNGELDVPAKHRVLAEGSGDLTLQSVPESVNHWKSQLHVRPGGYGKWLPATEQRAATQKAIPLTPPDNPSVTLYLLGIPVSRSDGPPVVVSPDSRFVVRGRINKPAKVYFGIAVSDGNGEFAGKFRGDLGGQQPISTPDEDGQFEVVYRIRDFTLDPCVRDREEELAVRPDDLVLNGVWAFTHTGGPSGLEVTEVELIAP